MLAAGLSIASTITFQFCIFTEMPFYYDVLIFYLTLIVSIACGTAVIASYIPARKLLVKPISGIIKGAA